ncbi:alanine racemase [Paraburkholderia rhizosphaerae]|nr:alanine racemase [Paraburkholderia rhizosphaerae]
MPYEPVKPVVKVTDDVEGEVEFATAREKRMTGKQAEFEITNALDNRARHAAKLNLAPVVMNTDLDILGNNFDKAKSLLNEGTEASVVLKADGYGLGASEVARELEQRGCNKFFVAAPIEAIDLRDTVKPQTKVYLLNGCTSDEIAHNLARRGITPVLNSPEEVRIWNVTARQRGEKLPAILQFETGMHREGIDTGERKGIKAHERKELALGSPELEFIEIEYIMSHLATADEAVPDTNAAMPGLRKPSEAMERQRKEFDEIALEYPGVKRSLGASAGMHVPDYQYDLVRMGGVVHGQQLFADGSSDYVQPVRVTGNGTVKVRHLKEGDAVGYGGTFVAPGPMRVGTLQAGYADGWPKQGGGHVLINGQRAPIIGKVSMDMMTVDLEGIDLGDESEIQRRRMDPNASSYFPHHFDGHKDTPKMLELDWKNAKKPPTIEYIGPQQTFDDVAKRAGTNASELSINMGKGPRVGKRFVKGDQ